MDTQPIDPVVVPSDLLKASLVPSLPELYTGPLTPWFIALICVAFAVLGAIIFVYVRQVKFILRHTSSNLLGRTLLMNSAYPIVGVASIASLLVPMASVFCETVCHLTYAMFIYQYFCLVVEYSGGESNMIKSTENQEVFSMRTPPCCCCCMFMKPTKLTKRSLFKLRMMVLQVPIIQGVLLFVLNIVSINNAHLYDLSVLCTLPIMIASVLTGEWSITVLVTMLRPFYEDFKLKDKFVTIQLILAAVKLQSIIAHEVLKAVHVENPGYPVTPRVMMNAILQLVLMTEMLLLAWWASCLYRNPRKPIAEVDFLE